MEITHRFVTTNGIRMHIAEAGGGTSDLQGKKQPYHRQVNGFVGSNKTMHSELLRAIRKRK